MALYNYSSITNLIERYENRGGHFVQISEGVLGWGVCMCYGPGLKTAVITEVFINEWSSGHKIRFYNATPKKYIKYI